MKTSEARRQFKRHGVKFVDGTKHSKLYLNGRQTVMPRHTEISNQLFKLIKKQLGIVEL